MSSQTERSYLVNLLGDGTDGTYDMQQQSIPIVSIGDNGAIYAEMDGLGVISPIQSDGQWSCTAAGLVTIQFEEETQSEYTVKQSVKIELMLHRATDRSLVIRQAITMRGVGQFFLPFRHEAVNWKRFAAADRSQPISQPLSNNDD